MNYYSLIDEIARMAKKHTHDSLVDVPRMITWEIKLLIDSCYSGKILEIGEDWINNNNGEIINLKDSIMYQRFFKVMGDGIQNSDDNPFNLDKSPFRLEGKVKYFD